MATSALQALSDEELWHYNCLDCVRTREVGEVELEAVDARGLGEVHQFQQDLLWPVLRAMELGVRVDPAARSELSASLTTAEAERSAWIAAAVGHSLNPNSHIQMKRFFYDDLKQKAILKRDPKSGEYRPTCDDDALTQIGEREPLLRALVRRIKEWRTLSKLRETFVKTPLDIDGRMRTSYNICGTDTFRFSSSKNAFGSGGNLQNVPAGGPDEETGLVLPNCRRVYVPDENHLFFDVDLSKADLRVVVWEADEREMKALLAEGRDPYIETAREFYHDPTIGKALADGSPNPRYRMFKSFCHGSHYLGTPHGLSRRLGLTVHEADRTQRWYFGKYPAIPRWQARFKEEVARTRQVRNKFGYVTDILDRIDDAAFRAAIAWLPQSTVACLINRIWTRLFCGSPWIQVLLQTHDSLGGQFPQERQAEAEQAIKEAGQVVIPYEEPLVIPIGLKVSAKSWGECA